MAYTKQTWNNGSAGATPLSATRLQHIEDGLESAATIADSSATTASAAQATADAAMPKAGGTFTGEIIADSINTTSGNTSIGNATGTTGLTGSAITLNGPVGTSNNSIDAGTGTVIADTFRASATLNLQTLGGDVSVGDATTTMTVNGELVARGYRLVSRTVHTSTPAAFTKASYPWLRAIKVMCLGGGGGGGGAAATAAGQNAIGASGAGGAYAETFITDIAGLASSVTLTVGAAGAAGAAGASGGGGGETSFGALCVAKGGNAGSSGGAAAVGTFAVGTSAVPANNSTGDIVLAGGASGVRSYLSATSVARPTAGGNFLFPNALSAASVSGTTSAGVSPGAGIYGVGGYAGINAQSQASAVAGGIGTGGLMIVELYA